MYTGSCDGITSSYQVRGARPSGGPGPPAAAQLAALALRGCGPAPLGARVRAPGALGGLPLGPHPSPAARPFGPGVSGSPGPCPPLPGGWPGPPAAAWPPARSGFACPFGAPLAALGRARWLGLSARGPCASPGFGAPPGAPACGRGLGPGCAPVGWLRPGPLCGLRLARPAGLCGLPAWVVGLGPLRAWPCAPAAAPVPPALAPALRGRAAASPPGSLPPVGRLGGPSGRWNQPPPPGVRKHKGP